MFVRKKKKKEKHCNKSSKHREDTECYEWVFAEPAI